MDVTKTDRDINKLSDNFKLKVIDFLKEVWDIIFITEWFRSKERQEYLYAQGRTTPWDIVTWVKHSNHQDWNAIDIAFKWDSLYPTNHSKWEKLWDIANKYWINWGFDLWNGVDKPHFQDNWKAYIPKVDKMEQFWKLILKAWLWSYSSSIYWIPVRFVEWEFTWLARVKWYLPWCTKDEILITKHTFRNWEEL